MPETPLAAPCAGKVEIGAFRTYPADYKPPDAAASEYQSIPLNKIEDFGVHAAMYYPLEVQIFKTSLDAKLIDLLWNKYWVNTLAASPLLSNKAFVAGQLDDVSAAPPPLRCMRCCLRLCQSRMRSVLTCTRGAQR